MQYLIAGAGPSGVTAAEALRKHDPNSSIILIDGEEETPYGRMALPYFLTGQIPESALRLRKKKGHFERLQIECLKGRVEKVSSEQNVVTLNSTDQLSFDRLLLATGSTPLKPRIPGISGSNIYHCWTLKDARKILKILNQGTEVVLIGAGFIGCIIMEALSLSGAKLTVLEIEDRMVPRMMDKTAGDLIKKWCLGRGISVLTSTSVIGIEDCKNKKTVMLENGKTIQADVIVVATGVKPNISFLKGSSIKVDQGVIVNNKLESNIQNIYAAGDVAQGPDFLTSGWSVHAVQPTGVEHGRIASLSMTGQDINYRGSLNMNVLDTLGLVSCSFGLWEGIEGGHQVKRLDEENFRYTVLSFDEDRLVGALLIGRTENIGIVRGLIQTSLKLGSWKDRLMVDPNQIVEAYIESTTAYSHIHTFRKFKRKNAEIGKDFANDLKKIADKNRLTEHIKEEKIAIDEREKSLGVDKLGDPNIEKINITLKLYAMLSKYLPSSGKKNEAVLKIAVKTNVQSILDSYNVPNEYCHLVLINGHYAAPSERKKIILEEGDVVAVWPPVAGG